VIGNFIGTNFVIPPIPPYPGTPAKAVPNTLHGVVLANAAFNIIGETGDVGRNIISGNGQYGILLDEVADDNLVRNNYIGTDDKGMAKIANGNSGVYIKRGFRNTIGGTLDAQRNVISGNNGYGVEIAAASDNNTVQKNYIGTQKDGKAPLGNTRGGIKNDGTNTKEIDNISAWNAEPGMHDFGTIATLIVGNFIGIAIDGTPAPNAGDGVLVENSTNVDITDGNIIASNAGHGVHIIGGSGHDIWLNGSASTPRGTRAATAAMASTSRTRPASP